MKLMTKFTVLSLDDIQGVTMSFTAMSYKFKWH
jgi:hypothetical protein